MTSPSAIPEPTEVQIHLCIPEDQERHLPKRRRAPLLLPRDVPLPRIGEVIYLSSSSAWTVRFVIHEWRSASELRIELWIECIGSARQSRPAGFELTQ